MRIKKLTKRILGVILFCLYLSCSINVSAQKQVIETKPSHFLFPEFNEGNVKMKSGELVSAKIDYNTVTQEMIFEKSGMRMAFDNLDEIDTVYLQDRKFIPVEKVFYEVLVNKPIAFFIQHKCNLLSEGKDIGYGKSKTTSTISYTELLGDQGIYKFKLPDGFYVAEVNLYWVRRGKEFYNANNKRKFLKAFPEKKAELEKFIKTNKIKFKDYNDIAKLVEYCNEIYK